MLIRNESQEKDQNPFILPSVERAVAMGTHKLLEIIQKAKKNKWRELDLSDQGIIELPPEIGQLVKLQRLHLNGNQLHSVPKEIGKLVNLCDLTLSGNNLTSLPAELGQLVNLRRLYLHGNQLMFLPIELGQLTNLHELILSNNLLIVAPAELGKLKKLQVLDISHNQLKTIPEGFGHLKNLRELILKENQLTSLLSQVDKLVNLRLVDLSHNQISDLPVELGRLMKLKMVLLLDNPIEESYPELRRSSIELLRFLRAFSVEAPKKQTRKRYEGKLMLLGDGEEGKTCVSRALRGLHFEEQVTTRGVDVVKWKFQSPSDPDNPEMEMTLNLWDFEGQEVHHQTHQFFLTTGSLYVLVFKCRELFNLERAEYWLDTIKARAPKSKVLLVITECEERRPLVPLDKLQASYPELWGSDNPNDWCFSVGCSQDPSSRDSGIPQLREQIQRLASDMNVMGRPWPESYTKAEEAIIKLCGSEEDENDGISYISRNELYGLFKEAKILKDNFNSVADFMDSLGVITHFPDCEKLWDFIVLKPQWLGKAISIVLEDPQLQTNFGHITHQHIQNLWAEKYPEMFLRFYECMKEFELCYDLDQSMACLIPLRFHMIKPDIPWILEPDGQILERRVFYKLNIRPPMGLMSRYIVKTHRLIVKTNQYLNGVYWYNGVFLRQGEGLYASEALCEFDQHERTLSITVRAEFPQAMQEQLHGIAEAVFAFYKGIQMERSYGCIIFDEEDERQCENKHKEKRILYAIQKKKETIDCEVGWHDVDPIKLVYGFTSFGNIATKEDLNKVADKLLRGQRSILAGQEEILINFDRILDSLDENVFAIKDSQQELSAKVEQKVQLDINTYLSKFDQMMDGRDFTSAPGLVSILPLHQKRFNWNDWFKCEYVLTPYCECEGEVHRCESASVIFKKSRTWWASTAPLLLLGLKTLTVGVTLSAAGAPLAIAAATGATTALAAEVYNDIKPVADFMKELLNQISKLSGASEGKAKSVVAGDYDKFSENLMKEFYGGESRIVRTQLQQLLCDIARDNFEARQWGDMRRVRMPDNTYRWMCNFHANQIGR